MHTISQVLGPITQTGNQGHAFLIKGAQLANEAALRQLLNATQAAGGQFFLGRWQQRLGSPFQGFTQIISQLVPLTHVLDRSLSLAFIKTMATLVPSLLKKPEYKRITPFQADLADYPLHGEKEALATYFRPNNNRARIEDGIIDILTKTGRALNQKGKTVVFCFTGLEHATAAEHWLLQNLLEYARGFRIQVVAFTASGASDLQKAFPDLAFDNQSWQCLTYPANGMPAVANPDENLLDGLARLAWLHEPFCGRRANQVLEDEPLWLALKQSGQITACGGGDYYLFSEPQLRHQLRQAKPQEEVLENAAGAARAEGAYFEASSYSAQLNPSEAANTDYVNALTGCWGASEFGRTLRYLEKLQKTTGQSYRFHLMYGLLYHQNRQFDKAETAFAAEAAMATSAEERGILFYLQGHNYVFGMGDFETGIGYLNQAIQAYEEAGDHISSYYARNSLAYALFRLNRMDDAAELEKLTISLLEGKNLAENFLKSIISLNLGRLYRNKGATEESLHFLNAGLNNKRSELTAYVVLVFNFTLGNVHFIRGEYQQALAQWQHCLQLMSDLEAGSDLTLVALRWLFNKNRGKYDAVTSKKFDIFSFYVHYNLSMVYYHLGCDAHADIYRRSAETVIQRFARGDEVAIRKAYDTIIPQKSGGGKIHGIAASYAQQVQAICTQLPDTLALETHEDGVQDPVAAQLATTANVLWVTPQTAGADVDVLSSYLLFNPLHGRKPGAHPPLKRFKMGKKRLFLALPEALSLFESGLTQSPLIIQQGDLNKKGTALLPKAGVYNLRVRILNEAFDGPLFRLLRQFYQKTGTPILGAVPFYIPGKDGFQHAAQFAIHSYLLSKSDLMVTGNNTVIRKLHGPCAWQNLKPLPLKISLHAAYTPPTPDHNYCTIGYREGHQKKYLKLNKKLQDFLGHLTGEQPLSGIVGQCCRDLKLEDGTQFYLLVRKLIDVGTVIIPNP